MRQDIRFLRCLYERLPRLLGITLPLKAAQQRLPGLHMLRPFWRSLGPVMQEHVSGLHCIGDEIAHSPVLAGVHGHSWFPAVSHAPKRIEGRAVA